MPFNCYEMKLILSATFTADEEYDNANELSSSEFINLSRVSQMIF